MITPTIHNHDDTKVLQRDKRARIEKKRDIRSSSVLSIVSDPVRAFQRPGIKRFRQEANQSGGLVCVTDEIG
jgi:hypothetical protein